MIYDLDSLVARVLALENRIFQLEDENKDLKATVEKYRAEARNRHRNELFPLDHLASSNS